MDALPPDSSRPGAPPEDPARRAFLAQLAILPVLASVPVGCGEREEPPAAPPVPPGDELPEAIDTADAGFAPLPRREPVVRVRIVRARESDAVVTLGAAGGWVLTQERPAAEAPPAAPSVHPGPLEIRRDRRGWLARGPGGLRVPVAPDSVFDVTTLERGAGATIEIDGVPHPGVARCHPRPRFGDGAFDVVNHVALERYLPGVLAKELFPHWHAEAFAAQAVAARSFACAEHAHFTRTRDHDMTNNATSQAYIGEASADSARLGARRTHGLVLSWDGALVPGYYSSCCGGRSAAAERVIGPHPFNRIPPLRGREGEDVCAEAPLYRWTIERPTRDVAAGLSRWLTRRGEEALSGLEAIDVAQEDEHGRPRTYAVRARGSRVVTIDAEALRRAVDDAGAAVSGTPLWSSDLTAGVEGATVRFQGRGHGHGAGLCQYGAEALARQGRTYEEILAWYYPGATVVRAYV